MTAQAEYKIMQLCKGMTLKQVDRRLVLMQRYVATKQTKLRMRVTGLKGVYLWGS